MVRLNQTTTENNMADKNTNTIKSNKEAVKTKPTIQEISLHEFSDKDIDIIYRKAKATKKEQDDISKASSN